MYGPIASVMLHRRIVALNLLSIDRSLVVAQHMLEQRSDNDSSAHHRGLTLYIAAKEDHSFLSSERWKRFIRGWRSLAAFSPCADVLG